jgi:hypothetical protein
VEPCPEFEQRGYPTSLLDTARRRLDDAADHLEQRALAGAVVADQTDRVARSDIEADIAERPEVLLVRAARTAQRDDPLLERRVLAYGETLGDVGDANDLGARGR